MISLESRIYTTTSPVKHTLKNSPSVFTLAGKRLFDLTVLLLLTPLLLSWLVPLLCLAIAVTSPGPVFFAQLRTGRNGRPFRCWRFRTTAFSPATSFQHAVHKPSAMTPVGRFLRATHLDELPLLFNVLTGDMSIVGPRPNPLQVDAQYWNMPAYQNRYLMRPGIIGLAQIRAELPLTPNQTHMQNSVRYDHWYVNQHSLGLDFKICWWSLTRKEKSVLAN